VATSQALDDYVLDELGEQTKLADISRVDVQDLADRLLARGLSAGTVLNALMPLRVICKRALERGEITVNPTVGLSLPKPGRRERVAAPAEADELLAALPEADRPLWGTAFYASLRRGRSSSGSRPASTVMIASQ
jgi:site-specific recombinase XerC